MNSNSTSKARISGNVKHEESSPKGKKENSRAESKKNEPNGDINSIDTSITGVHVINIFQGVFSLILFLCNKYKHKLQGHTESCE